MKVRVRIEFIEPILGSASGNKELFSEFIAGKAPDAKSIEEEIEAMGVEAVDEKGTTVFPRLEDGTPYLWDYQIRGFFKSACDALNMAEPSKKLTAYKKKIDKLVFVSERKIPLVMPEGSEIGYLERPLRAQTMQGERVALAKSEMIPSGTTAEFTIEILSKELVSRVDDWLDYGKYNGLGQWRNGSYGRFTWQELG